jgi:hypothetical protein
MLRLCAIAVLLLPNKVSALDDDPCAPELADGVNNESDENLTLPAAADPVTDCS